LSVPEPVTPDQTAAPNRAQPAGIWSGLCFVGLAVNNLALVVDLMALPDADLSTWRLVPAAAGTPPG
jgi:hypothetical protein